MANHLPGPASAGIRAGFADPYKMFEGFVTFAFYPLWARLRTLNRSPRTRPHPLTRAVRGGPR